MLRLLRQHGNLIGFKSKLAMLDEEQQKTMIEEVAKALVKAALTQQSA